MSGKRTVIAGGTVATESAVFAADVVIEDGRIAALAEPGAGGPRGRADRRLRARRACPARSTCTPTSRIPGHTEREDFTTGTMAAAAGGITTVFEHPLTYPPVTTTELYREKREMASRKVVVDFGLWGALTAPSIPEIAGQWAEGAAGFKAFMPVSDPSYPHVTDAEFLDGMREVEGRRRPRARARRERLAAAGRASRACAPQGRRDPLAHHESRPAVRRGGGGASRALPGRARRRAHPDRARLEPRQRRARARARSARGRPVTMEICPHHLLLDLDDLVRLGPYGVCAPALRERALVERLWDFVLDGTADCLVSDHSAYTREEKDAGCDDIFPSPLGCQVMQETVPLVLDEAFHRRGMPLDAFVRFSLGQRGAHQRHVSAQGHAAARARTPTSCSTTSSSEWQVDAAQPAVLEEPVVALRRPARAGARHAHARARRDGVRRRRDPRASRARAASSPVTATTRSQRSAS